MILDHGLVALGGSDVLGPDANADKTGGAALLPALTVCAAPSESEKMGVPLAAVPNPRFSTAVKNGCSREIRSANSVPGTGSGWKRRVTSRPLKSSKTLAIAGLRASMRESSVDPQRPVPTMKRSSARLPR